jgi:hypothetical protein
MVEAPRTEGVSTTAGLFFYRVLPNIYTGAGHSSHRISIEANEKFKAKWKENETIEAKWKGNEKCDAKW